MFSFFFLTKDRIFSCSVMLVIIIGLFHFLTLRSIMFSGDGEVRRGEGWNGVLWRWVVLAPWSVGFMENQNSQFSFASPGIFHNSGDVEDKRQLLAEWPLRQKSWGWITTLAGIRWSERSQLQWLAEAPMDPVN